MADESTKNTWSWLDDEGADWVPPIIDLTTPSVARMYDYMIGGKDNFASDRDAVEHLLAAAPSARMIARANREFLIRTVRRMAEAGIDQFVDLGAGIPTTPNVHETVREIRPDASVVYVDNDPVVLAHHRAALSGDPRLRTVSHDLREPRSVLDDPALRKVIDFDRPIGVLLVAVLHFVELTLAPVVVSRYIVDLPVGSQVAITAICRDGVDPKIVRAAEAVYTQSSAPAVSRTRAQIEQLFDGLTLTPNGVEALYVDPDGNSILGGVGIK